MRESKEVDALARSRRHLSAYRDALVLGQDDLRRGPGRGPVFACHGMVCGPHPLAVAAGLQALRDGGHAVDAAIAMAAVVAVVEPYSNGLGGDAFLLLYEAASGRVTAVNASGAAPAETDPEAFGPAGMPLYGAKVATIPGAVDGWLAAHRRWGRLDLRRLLAPAIGYARDGFPISEPVRTHLALAEPELCHVPTFAQTFLSGGAVPRPGQLLRNEGLARTLEAIADRGREGFYDGPVAEEMVQAVRAAGGWWTLDDLNALRAEVLEPLSASYRGHDVHEVPPMSQGFILLEALNILEGFDLAGLGHLSAEAIHLMVEAKRLAFADRDSYAGDPRSVPFPVERLISKEHAAAQRTRIDPRRAGAMAGEAVSGDTTSFVVADREGNAVTMIQSIYGSWGCGLVAGDTGVLLNNRMLCFRLEEGHPNRVAPGKRPLHTLNVYVVTRDGRLVLAGGAPGADRQVQTNLQVITGILDFGLHPQGAVDALRWAHTAGVGLFLEAGLPEDVCAALAARGHAVYPLPRWSEYAGRQQLVAVDPESGVLVGASDLRGEGCALGW